MRLASAVSGCGIYLITRREPQEIRGDDAEEDREVALLYLDRRVEIRRPGGHDARLLQDLSNQVVDREQHSYPKRDDGEVYTINEAPHGGHDPMEEWNE